MSLLTSTGITSPSITLGFWKAKWQCFKIENASSFSVLALSHYLFNECTPVIWDSQTHLTEEGITEQASELSSNEGNGYLFIKFFSFATDSVKSFHFSAISFD